MAEKNDGSDTGVMKPVAAVKRLCARAGAWASSRKPNTDTSFLKLIAIATMLVDHLGARVFPQYPIMRIIGRIAFPIFAYCIAVGCSYTRNIARYMLRVLGLAVVVQPLYVTAMGHQTMGAFDWAHNFYRLDLILRHYYAPRLSILFTLVAGIALIWTLRNKKYPLTAVMIAALWYTSGYLDYGLNGILLMLLFWTLLNRPAASFVWVAAFMIWWGVPALRTRFEPWNITRVYTQFYAVLALPFIYIPLNTKIKVNKWVFYAFYPAHLVLIYLLTMPK